MHLLNKLSSHPNDIIIGVDEVARGTLFGRVYAAAVLFDENYENDGIKDSKKLSRKRRAILRKEIEQDAISYGIGYVENEEIDEINILNAAYKAMYIAINNLIKDIRDKDIVVNRILVDGNRYKIFVYDDYGFIPHTCIEKADNLYLPVAAASILAKEYHDEYINKLCDEEPELEKYGLRNHVGYGTKKHYGALKEFGATKYHRKSFNLHLL